MAPENVEANKSESGGLLVATFMIFASFLFLGYLTLRPASEDADIAAVFPPTMSLTDISSRLAHLPYDLVRTGWSDNIVIVKPQSQSATPDMLQQNGAWLVLDAIASGGCSFYATKKTEKA